MPRRVLLAMRDRRFMRVTEFLLERRGYAVVQEGGSNVVDAAHRARADVGLAMGTGTDVALAAADVNLLGGSLAAVAEGLGSGIIAFGSGEEKKAVEALLKLPAEYGLVCILKLGIPEVAGTKPTMRPEFSWLHTNAF